MGNQRSDTGTEADQPVESPMKQGQVEQVVCSADCRSARRNGDHQSESHQQIREGTPGRQAASPDDQPDILTIEDRLLIALAGRGHRTIDRFIRDAKDRAWAAMDRRPPVWDLVSWPDDELIAALEAEAFR